MPTALGRTVERVRTAVRPAADSDTDAALLGRYAADRDGEAFAALVRRHGPMVLAVCRRVTGDCHLADDAFQATFLVLVRRAADVRPADAVGRFLYGVAGRVALDARTVARRRRERERPVAAVPDRAVTPPGYSDAAAVIDEELRRLPARHRELLVACDVLGRPRAEVARALRVPDGTLCSRLTTARKLLAARLTARGLAPVVSLAVLPVPAALAESASNLGAGGAVPPAIESLTRGAVAMSALSKLRLVALAGLVAAVGWAVAADPATVPARRAAPAKADDPSRILVWTEGRVELLRADGSEVRAWRSPDIPASVGVALSPDRKRAAVGLFVAGRGPGGVVVYDLDQDKLTARPVRLPGTEGVLAEWSADGKAVRVLVIDGSNRARETIAGVFDIDVTTGEARKVVPASLPAGHTPYIGGPTAGWLLTTGPYAADTKTLPTYLVRAGGDPVRLTGKGEDGSADVSPDGEWVRLSVTRVTVTDPVTLKKTPDPAAPGVELFACHIASGKRTSLARYTDGETLGMSVWSPDSRRLLVSELRPKSGTAVLRTIGVAGTPPKTIREVQATAHPGLAWR